MSPKEIETLKLALSNMARQGCGIRNETYGVNGKIVGIGFKPYWTSPVDSKIEKLELNILDNYGRIMPFNFYHVIKYDVVSFDGKRLEDSKNISLDIYVYSPDKNRDEESHEKIRLDIIGDH